MHNLASALAMGLFRYRLRAKALLLVACCAVATPAAAQVLRLGGTGAALGSVAMLAKAYQQQDPNFQFEIVPNLGSAGGVKALSAGVIQLAVVGRALKAEEASPGLRVNSFGKTAFVLATTKPGVEGLTLAGIADLYSGKNTRWSDGQPVRLVLRPASDGDTTLLASFSPAVKAGVELALSRDGMVTGMTDQDAVDAIERLPGGLGTASLSLLMAERRRARALAIDGVAPTLQNLISGRYPYAKPMYFASKVDAPASVVKFLAYARSEAGRRVLAESGVVPDLASPASMASR